MSENYINFFNKVKKFKKEQMLQKQRGLNDYNIVNIVRNENEEVGMHSNVIYSLINPNGLHYQGNLFLNIFIKYVLGLNIEQFGDILSVNVEEITNQNRRIDFTIKSSKYYIGIEMKINAYDLDNQISHYYNDLINKSQNDNNQEVIIYYLTKDGKEASKYSHNNISYEKISFKKHILAWLEICQEEVQNITNLNEAFENYKNIVKKVIGNYKSKVKNMDEIILENKKNLEMASEIYNNFDKVKNKIVEDFFSTYLIDYFTDKFNSSEEYSNWEIKVNLSTLKNSYSYPIQIMKKNSNWKLAFQFGFDTSNMNNGYYGISRMKENVPLNEFRKDKCIELENWKKNTSTSIFWDYTTRRYSYDTKNLIAFKFEKDIVAQEFFELFDKTIKQLQNTYNLTLDTLNEKLNKFILENKTKQTI